MQKQPAVYILANKYMGTLYTGVTSNVIHRVWQHKEKLAEGFTRRYAVDRLVYFELTEDMTSAIAREKQIEAGSRKKKIELIERVNSEWRDLYPNLCQ